MSKAWLGWVICVTLSACGSTVLKKSGESCTSDGQCGNMLCLHGVCTNKCGAQTDCAVGFDCGIADPADKDATCYKRTYNQAKTGGFETACSAASVDPKTGVVCDTMAENPCKESGFFCLAALKCDPSAYCTTSCNKDTECPFN